MKAAIMTIMKRKIITTIYEFDRIRAMRREISNQEPSQP
jgi:hypothetical protein